MAEWKKVIVSGSNISELVNDANYLVDAQDSAVLSGSFSGSFQGDGSGLTGVVATNAESLVDGNGIADFTYDGSQAAQVVAVEVSGSTLTVNSAGVAVNAGGITPTQLADDAVTEAKISTNAVTSGKIAENAVGTTALAADAVTGDQIADDAVDSEHIATGAIDDEHYASGSVQNNKLANSSVTIGSTAVSLGDTATTITGLTSVTSTGFTGDLTGTADSASYVAAGDIDGDIALGTATSGNYVQSVANATNGGIDVTNGSAEGGDATLAININDLSAVTIDVSQDLIAIHDADGDTTGKESVADLVAGIAGTNLSAASGQLSLSSTIANDHTFSNNLTIQGNLTVEGSQINAQVANLDVEDRFILLNSGSSTRADSGIIFGGADQAANSGSALFWDADYNSNDGRLAIGDRIAGSNTADITPFYHIVGFFEGTDAEAATNQFDHKGNIRIESDEIYIYV